MRRLPFALLAAAIVVGAILRCANLATLDLSPDESATWIAASAPAIGQVLAVQARANPGELGLHDVALHLWMRLFGDTLVAMRSFSALAGTIAIIMVFLVAREALALAPTIEETTTDDRRDLTAAITTLFFAVNLITIKYAREARMYPLALTLTLAQMWFFLRAMRQAKTADLLGLAAMTALATIATFTSALILIPEGLYLLLLLAKAAAENRARVMCLGAALAIGLLLVTPFLLLSIHLRGGAPNPQTWEWIPRPAPWATITLFSKAIGTYAFPLLAILVVSGVFRQWGARRDAIVFLLLWTFAPPLFLTAFSWVLQPAFVERYLLACFVPFFLLAAIGVLESQPVSFRPGAVALVVVLSLTHFVAWSRKPHGLPWALATVAATTGLNAGDAIGVAPRSGISVVRYYVRDAKPMLIVEAVDADPPPTVVIVATGFDHDKAAALAQRYPRVLANLREVVVRAR
jgi:4-amino-4-deoxy-L-arabinose transferase-like glycosyltransferase